MNLSHIAQGWRNAYFPPEEIKEQIEQVRSERMAICEKCPDYSLNKDSKAFKYCSLCGCPIKAKTSCLSCDCGASQYNLKHPEDIKPVRWTAVLSDEEDEKIEQYLKNEKEGL